jgi:hypothetical protein
MKRNAPKAPTAVRGSLGITYHPKDKANVIANCSEDQFTSHEMCDENHERQVETRVKALLASVDGTTLGKIRPCDIHKLANLFKLRKACGLDGIPKECITHLARRPLVHLTHLFNHCLRRSHFPKLWTEAEAIMLSKPDKDPKFPQNLRPISLLFTTSKLFEKVILKMVQRHIEERGLLNTRQFGFRARHITTLQCMRLTEFSLTCYMYDMCT